jgi:PilZ domain-containing protein
VQSAVDSGADERRKFPRLNAPLYFRPARRRLPRRQVVDVGLGGMRVYSDEPLNLGARFEIELFLPDRTSVDCLTEVVWVKPIEGGNPAPFDIGLQFLDVPPDALEQLRALLEKG